MKNGNPEAELAETQRNQFANYIVRIAVALGIVDGREPYTGDQVAFLAETAVKAICTANDQRNTEFGLERRALLESMPPSRGFGE